MAPTSSTLFASAASRLTEVFSTTVSVFRLDQSDHTVSYPVPGDETVIIQQTSFADLHGSSETYFAHSDGTAIIPRFWEDTPRGQELQAILVQHGYDIRYEEV